MLFSSFALCHIQNLSSRQSKSLGSFNCFQIANRQFSSIEQYNTHTQSKKKTQTQIHHCDWRQYYCPSLSPLWSMLQREKKKGRKVVFVYCLCKSSGIQSPCDDVTVADIQLSPCKTHLRRLLSPPPPFEASQPP